MVNDIFELKNEYFLFCIKTGVIKISMVNDIFELKNEYFLFYIKTGDINGDW